jgi:hypothetical protein
MPEPGPVALGYTSCKNGVAVAHVLRQGGGEHERNRATTNSDINIEIAATPLAERR